MLWRFVKATTREWGALMGCALFTVLGVCAQAMNRSSGWVVGCSLVLAGVLLVVACYRAWAEQTRKLDRLTAHAEIKGNIRSAFWIPAEADGDGMIVVQASIVNHSSEVSPTIRQFVCNIDVGGQHFESVSTDRQPFSDRIISYLATRGYSQANLGMWNHLGMVKHQHREGCVVFPLHAASCSSDQTGMIRFSVVDGGDFRHLIEEFPWPVD